MKIRIPDSISAMVYTMRHPVLWTLMVWAIASVGYWLMCRTSEDYIPLAFASCGCIGFVGAMPLIRNENNTLHWVCGIGGCVLSQIWCILVTGLTPVVAWWWAYSVLLTILLCTEHARQWCFWMELWCMAAVAWCCYY